MRILAGYLQQPVGGSLGMMFIKFSGGAAAGGYLPETPPLYQT